MFTLVIPKIGDIITSAGQSIPIYTLVVLDISRFPGQIRHLPFDFYRYRSFFLIRYVRTGSGKESLDQFKLSFPYVGKLYHKLYLSRIADNMYTMLSSGITMIKALEVTAAIVDNKVYSYLLRAALERVKSGSNPRCLKLLINTKRFRRFLFKWLKSVKKRENLEIFLKPCPYSISVRSSMPSTHWFL